MKDTQAEVLKLRKQLVAMEKGRNDLVNKSSMQQRSAQMTIAGQQRTLAEKAAGLDKAMVEHQVSTVRKPVEPLMELDPSLDRLCGT